MNKKILDLFEKIKPEDRNIKFHRNSKVIIIDGINTFIRAFSVVNYHNKDAIHVGGLTGFLKSIGSAVKLLEPTHCIITFDGEEGSRSRKYLFPEYKANRNKVTKPTNYKSFSTKREEDIAKYNEMSRLMDYLHCLPVNIICIDRLEADDVIGYLSNKIYQEYSDSNIWIMSSDQDFFQLINDRTFVYSPIKKKIYNTSLVESEYGIHPENFLLYKTLLGDTSDNVPGVHGFGEKNTPLLIEMLKTNKRKTLKDLYEVCENPPKKSLLYDRVLEMKPMVEIFYKIMNIREPNISDEDKEILDEMINRKLPGLKKYEFSKLCQEDQLGASMINPGAWLNAFSLLNHY